MTDTITDQSLDRATDGDQPLAFDRLGLPAPLLQATQDAGFSQCTEIQGLSLPGIINGNDIAAQAQTGTGKTAAFLLGAMSLMLEKPASDKRLPNQPRLLVIAPTRELAIQIGRDAEQLGKHTDFKVQVVYGGKDYEKQKRALENGVDILVGTPGRLIDYYKQRAYHLKHLEIVVLDEADRMFDLGFISDIRYLLRRMPPPENRISMLFSATLSNQVMELSYEHMNNPATVKTDTTQVTADGVRQRLYHPAADEKISLLVGLLRQFTPERAIVFVNTRRVSEIIENYLQANDIDCGTLSGDVRQSKRQRILQRFTQGELSVLIATDVAARGLHIDNVTHVFNYDLPQQAEDYVHRIGRTARAGTQGEAVSFACEEYAFSLPEITEYIGHSIATEAITEDLLPELTRPARTSSRRSVGNRKHSGQRSSRNNQNRGGNKPGGGNRRRSRRRNAPRSNDSAQTS